MAREEKAYARVIEKVKTMILSGELKPGEKLPPERKFAEKLEVSRNSVREAIRIMDMMGIVSSQQGSGNYVTCEFQKSITETMAMMFAMDQVNDKQISQVRYSLEVLAFTLALDRVREEDLAKMEECVEKLDKNGDSKNNATLDKIIHYTLARASGNQLLIDILEACSGVFDIFIEDMRYGILKNENRKTELNECHRHLVDALREGDREKGLQALKWHFEMIDEVLG